jgi:hypothetical protein
MLGGAVTATHWKSLPRIATTRLAPVSLLESEQAILPDFVTSSFSVVTPMKVLGPVFATGILPLQV